MAEIAEGTGFLAAFGREAVLEELVRTSAPSSVLVGDQGVGKSHVLRIGQEESRRRGSLAPEPLRAELSEGAAARLLLRALSECVAEFARQDRRAIDRLQALVQVLLAEIPSAVDDVLRQAAVGQLIRAVDLLLPGVGSEVVAAVSDIGAKLRGPGDLILNASEESSATVVSEIAGAVSLWAGTDVALALDSCELLPTESLRVLGDLPPKLPPGVRIRLALEDSTPQGAEAVRLLTAHADDCARFSLDPLRQEAVEKWLSASGIDPQLAALVIDATSGYGLHVHEMIGHLSSGGGIDDFGQSMREADFARSLLDQLSDEEQTAVRRLSVLTRPITVDGLCSLLEIDEERWWALDRRFRQSRIFATRIEGRAWFHEMRRRWILHDHMEDAERSLCAHRALDPVWAELERSSDLEWAPEYARLLDLAGSRIEHEQLRVVRTLSLGALAVATALLEVTDGDNPAAIAGSVLDLARRRHHAPESLLDGLRELGDAGLVHVVEAEHAAAIAPTWQRRDAIVLLGRSVLAGLAPVPHRALLLFRAAVAPRISEFDVAAFGIGTEDLIDTLETLRTERPSEVLGRPLESVLLRGTFGSTPWFAGIRFSSRDARDNAVQELTGLEKVVGGERVCVRELIPTPQDRLRIGRLFGAWAWVANGRVTWTYGHPSVPSAEGWRWEEIPPAQTKLARIVYEHLSTLERLVLRLEDGRHLYWDTDGTGLVQFVAGGTGDFRETRIPGLTGRQFTGPYRSLLEAEALGLPPGSWIRAAQRSHGTPGWQDPYVQELSEFLKRAQSWNRRMDKVDLDLAPAKLAPQLDAAFAERRALAAKLASLPHMNSVHQAPGRWLFLIGPPWRGEVPDPLVVYGFVPEGEVDAADVVVTDVPLEGWGQETFVREFKVDEDCWRGAGPATHVFADFLGYLAEDLSAWRGAVEVGLTDPPPWW